VHDTWLCYSRGGKTMFKCALTELGLQLRFRLSLASGLEPDVRALEAALRQLL